MDPHSITQSKGRTYRSPKTTTGALIMQEGKVLTQLRTQDPFKGKWGIPGGHIELGETPEQAVAREVKEEVGLSFQPTFYRYFVETFPDIDWYAVILVFTGTFEGNVTPNHEVAEARWLTPQEALKLPLAFVNKEIFESLLEHKGEQKGEMT